MSQAIMHPRDHGLCSLCQGKKLSFLLTNHLARLAKLVALSILKKLTYHSLHSPDLTKIPGNINYLFLELFTLK